jgi:TonB family protein
MAHHPMYEFDPEKPGSSAAEGRAESHGVSSGARTPGESDLAELAAKLTTRGGGGLSAAHSTDLALEVVLNEIVEQACLAIGASGAAIVLERGGEWICRASAGSNAPQPGSKLDTEAGLSGACVKTRKVQRCDDAQADPRADMEACRNLGVRSVIILPLLLKGELVGVFEVFSSWPSAFGERDERTLEALSRRVLKNLERASEPSPAAVEPSRGAYPIMADIIAEDFIGADFVAANLIAADPVGKNPVGENFIANNVDATSDAVYGSSDKTLPQPPGETASDRGINLITWVLGVTVLAVAVLLAVRVVQRLSGGKAVVRAHPTAAIPAPSTGSAVTSSGATQGAASVSSGNRSETRSSGTPASVASAASTAGAARPTDSSPPAGSLLVYEKGKEVFRLPPAQGSEVERASAVEPDRAVDVSEEGVLRRVEPEYPEEARQKRIEGPMVVDVYIDKDGRVLEVKIVSGPPLLAQAVRDAVKQWIFKPHNVNGHPVQMQRRITLNFRLPH